MKFLVPEIHDVSPGRGVSGLVETRAEIQGCYGPNVGTQEFHGPGVGTQGFRGLDVGTQGFHGRDVGTQGC